MFFCWTVNFQQATGIQPYGQKTTASPKGQDHTLETVLDPPRADRLSKSGDDKSPKTDIRTNTQTVTGIGYPKVYRFSSLPQQVTTDLTAYGQNWQAHNSKTSTYSGLIPAQADRGTLPPALPELTDQTQPLVKEP